MTDALNRVPYCVLVVNEETPQVNTENPHIEFIMISLTLNNVPAVLVAIPST